MENCPKEVTAVAKELADLYTPGLILFVVLETYGLAVASSLASALYKLSDTHHFGGDIIANPLKKLNKLSATPRLYFAAKILEKYDADIVIEEIIKQLKAEHDIGNFTIKVQVLQYPIAPDIKKKIGNYLDKFDPIKPQK